ncbi:Nucleoside diphosphate kinase 7 [Amphibalanus amphitrite]|uniref:Nucleoside diphosphate kinase 7 n=1 Tax=Amphibalanus amphitrite TaxID=1232801 RepID=A0A6A4X9V9_AMPAM|nr:Nucleoside diphosphate kinase 7 [Amphibalanus amphitrite]
MTSYITVSQFGLIDSIAPCSRSAGASSGGGGMSGPADDRLVFNATWHDERAALLRHFVLSYYVDDGTLELFEPKLRRVFLRRSAVDTVAADDLWVGARLNVFGRQVELTDYGTEVTRRLLSQRTQRTLAIVKPDGVANLGHILNAITLHGLKVTQARMVRLTRAEAETFYAEHAARTFFPKLVEYMTSGPVVALELLGRDAVARWRQMMGPTDSEAARRDVPDSIRAQYGTDKTLNAVHGSDGAEAAAREIPFFFPAERDAPRPRGSVELCGSSTCAVVRPHIVRDGLLGQLLAALQAADSDLQITGLELQWLTEARAREFLEPYRGAVAEFPALAAELASGPAVALALRWPCQGADAVEAFRRVVGPRDPAIAALLRPQSLRAKFGRDRVRNALHCTDLADDGPLECRFFFGGEES